jgi:hypothetical protein
MGHLPLPVLLMLACKGCSKKNRLSRHGANKRFEISPQELALPRRCLSAGRHDGGSPVRLFRCWFCYLFVVEPTQAKGKGLD